MIHHFFAYIARLRYIRRWGLMRSSMSENDAEHSLQVAMLAHGMALIGKIATGATATRSISSPSPSITMPARLSPAICPRPSSTIHWSFAAHIKM